MQTSCCSGRRASSPALLPSHQYFVKKKNPERLSVVYRLTRCNPVTNTKKNHQNKSPSELNGDSGGWRCFPRGTQNALWCFFIFAPRRAARFTFPPGGCHLDCCTAIPVCVYTSKKFCRVKLSIFSITDVSHIQTPQCKEEGLEAAVHPVLFHFWINDDSLYVHSYFLWKCAHVMWLGKEKIYKSAT